MPLPRYHFFTRSACLLLAAVCCAVTAYAQTYQVRRYTVSDGLPDMYVLNLYQDSHGFLWVGTNNGLSRFDGKEFVNFGYADGLPNEYVNWVFEDSRHRLWVGTRSGMAEMKGNHFQQYPIGDHKKIEFVFSIVERPGGEIWALTSAGVYAFHTDHWEKLGLFPGFENTSCRNLVDVDGGTILNYGDCLVKMSSRGTYELLARDTLNWPYFNVISGFGKDIYLSAGGGLFHMEGSRMGKLFGGYLSHKRILSYFKDSHDRFWISTLDSGLVVTFPGDTTHIAESIPLKIPLVSQIFEDRDLNIWVASAEGLLRIERPGVGKYSSEAYPELKSLRNIFCTPQGKIVVASQSNGLLSCSLLTKSEFRLRKGPRQSVPMNTIIDGYCVDSLGGVWMIGRSGQLFRMDGQSCTELAFGQMGRYGGFFGICSRVGKGSLFVSSDTLYEGDANSFRQFIPANTGKPVIFPVKIHSFRNGMTLVNTRDKGVMMIDAENRIQSLGRELGIPDNSGIINFYEEPSGKFWISFIGGIKRYHWNGNKKPVEEITIDQHSGLQSNAIFSMAFDKQQRLWALSVGSVIAMEFDSTGKLKNMKNWNAEDGVTGENWRDGNLALDSAGSVWVQLIDRLYHFSPSAIRLDYSPPRTVITNIQLNLQETNWTKYTDSLEGFMKIPANPVLPYNQNTFGIYYKGISFEGASGITYSYMIRGSVNEWSTPQKAGFVSLVKLPPGTYEFMVRSKGSNTIWSEPAVFRFSILEPFWQRWWFIGLVIAVVSFLLYRLVQFIIMEKLGVLHVRQKLHRDLHDDIGATLSSIKVYTEVLQQDPSNHFIIELIRNNAVEMISQLELISWATDPQNDSFKSLTELMNKFALPACHAKKIELSMELSGISDSIIIQGPVRQHLFMIFKEVINNVIKYSGADKCQVLMQIRHRHFIMQISDNGKGLNGEIKGTGNGIRNMKRRAEEMGGTADVQNRDEGGVCVTLHLPYPFKIPYTWDERRAEYR